MSKTRKDDKFKKPIKIDRKWDRDKDLRIQRNLEAQEQEILERFGIKNSMYIRWWMQRSGNIFEFSDEEIKILCVVVNYPWAKDPGASD